MIEMREFLLHARLESATLETWVEAGWILPEGEKDEPKFSEADLARARLIQDLKDKFGVNDEGVEVILDLVDQIHGLRRALGEVLISRPTKSRS